MGTAIVKLREGGNFDRFVDDVKTEVEAIDNFPQETELPIIKPLGRTDRRDCAGHVYQLKFAYKAMSLKNSKPPL